MITHQKNNFTFKHHGHFLKLMNFTFWPLHNIEVGAQTKTRLLPITALLVMSQRVKNFVRCVRFSHRQLGRGVDYFLVRFTYVSCCFLRFLECVALRAQSVCHFTLETTVITSQDLLTSGTLFLEGDTNFKRPYIINGHRRKVF